MISNSRFQPNYQNTATFMAIAAAAQAQLKAQMAQQQQLQFTGSQHRRFLTSDDTVANNGQICAPIPLMPAQSLHQPIEWPSPGIPPLSFASPIFDLQQSPNIKHEDTIISESGEQLNDNDESLPNSTKSEIEGRRSCSKKRPRLSGCPSNKTAEVWRYFTQLPTSEHSGQSARCNICMLNGFVMF